MARIAGINIPNNKKIEIALTYIFGIGKNFSYDILKKANVDSNKRTKDLTDDEVNKLRVIIEKEYRVEGYITHIYLSITIGISAWSRRS